VRENRVLNHIAAGICCGIASVLLVAPVCSGMGADAPSVAPSGVPSSMSRVARF